MRQPQKTLAYAKALQYWVEKAQSPLLGELHQIAKSVLKLWRAMESLTTFTNAEVLEDTQPLHWVRIMSFWMSEPMDPPTSWEQSNSRSQRAHARVIFVPTHCEGHLKSTVTTWVVSPSPAPIQKVGLQQEEPSSGQKTPPPVFMEIARSLHGDGPSHVVTGIPLELAKEQGPIQMVGSTMFSARLLQDAVSGTTFIDMVSYSMSLVGLGVTPLVGDCSMPTLLGEEDMDSN